MQLSWLSQTSRKKKKNLGQKSCRTKVPRIFRILFFFFVALERGSEGLRGHYVGHSPERSGLKGPKDFCSWSGTWAPGSCEPSCDGIRPWFSWLPPSLLTEGTIDNKSLQSTKYSVAIVMDSSYSFVSTQNFSNVINIVTVTVLGGIPREIKPGIWWHLLLLTLVHLLDQYSYTATWGTITRVSRNLTFAQNKKWALSGWFLLVFLCLTRRVPPCAVKTCAVRPVFARVVGELRAADPNNVQGPVKQNASPGEQSEAPRPRWKPGQEQHPGPENQDSQHMLKLKQPRGSFPN